MRGRLITLEGGEGAGKSTVIAALADVLRERGIAFRQAREPGGTPVGEAVRAVLLDPALHGGLCAQTELLLMMASRAQLVREVIEPALAAGEWVLCDRFVDASYAYQAGGRGLDHALVDGLQWAFLRLPDLTFLLDVPVATGLERARSRGGELDRIESESEAFFERVRAAYRERAAAEPARFRVIDATLPAHTVAQAARAYLLEWIDASR